MSTDFYFFTDADFDILDQVVELAEKKAVKPAQIVMTWLLHLPAIIAPVIGFSKMYQLEEAVGALDVELSSEECGFLEDLYQPRPALEYE